MRCFGLTVLAFLALAVPSAVRADLVHPPVGGPQGLLCRQGIGSAERGSGIPPHLLAAISRVESGRRDPVTGDWHPWPWTANAEGQGFFYDSKAEAVAAVRAMLARGIRSIDVGCMQINLMHHPDAFPSLDVAFDPQANAAYAARFLKELYAQTGDWTKALLITSARWRRYCRRNRIWRAAPSDRRWPRRGEPPWLRHRRALRACCDSSRPARPRGRG
jgi:soluble lytic murein transglycosylase-like protein